MAETEGAKRLSDLPPDCSRFAVTAQEDGNEVGGCSFVGYVVAHRTMGATRQTVFASVEPTECFVIVEQSATRCTVFTCATEADLLRLVPCMAEALTG